ncbi:MAG: DUF4386 domain-containing protein [Candidatus Thorarchaeota archaeon]
MNQELGLAPKGCARNAGIFLLIRLALGSLVYISLGTGFPIPSEGMLTAVESVRANVFLYIGVLATLFFMGLFSLIVAFPLNNTLTSIDKDLSKGAQISRWLELMTFIAGMVLLFAGVPLFYPVLLIGLVFYTLYLSLIGYLVYVSGYLSRILGVTMIVSGLVGYLSGAGTGFTFWVSTVGAYIAIITEVVFGIYFVVKAMQIEVTDPRVTIAMILEELGEATTTEIIEESAKVSAECKDRIPEALRTLESENKLTKRFSKKKKGYVWSLVS